MSKDTFYSVVPLNWLLRSVGLSNIYRKGKQLAESGSKAKCSIYIIGFGLLNILVLYHKMIIILTNKQNSFSGSVQLTYWLSYLAYIINIYFVYKHRIFHLKYFKAFDGIDNILGNVCYDNIRKCVSNNVILTSIIFFLNSLFDYICWSVVEGWHPATIYSVDYLYFLLSMFTVLDIISHVVQVEYRLKLVCDLLQTCNTTSLTELNNKNTRSRIFADDKKNKPLNTLTTLCTGKYIEIVWFSKCYLLLLKQVAYINSSYGFRVLVYCINLLINIINNLNLAIRLVNGTLELIHPDGSFTFLPSLSSTMRALNYSVMIFILMYRCEQAYGQTDRILETIDELLSKEDNCKVLKTQLLECRNLVITRPIKFHAAKFFTMDYTLLVSLSSVVVTYTIIILQSMQ